MGTLTVYRASAGSGKTFTLASEYIRLLILSPAKYREILAVTFTNKATAEMKQRILSQLYGIAYGLPDSDSYLNVIQTALSYKEELIRHNARIALHLILHDFSFFHVETIDSFFQTVMRNLVHELQLTSNLTVELNAKAAAEEAVDKMLDTLTPDSPIISWILDAIGENIDENRNWNITRNLKRFAVNLFNETYQKHSQNIETLLGIKDFASAYKQTLRDILEKEKLKMRDYAEAFFNSLEEENGYTINDLSYGKSGGAGYFLKLRDGNCHADILGKRVVQFMESPKNWPASKLNKEDKNKLMTLAENEWIDLLNATEQARIVANRRIMTCQAIAQHFNELALLNSIHSSLQELNRDKNRFLLAYTTKLLYDLIEDADTSFIFEKLGTRLKHLMIDEFQDTSRMQWNNFRPLLSECLASGNDCLIVGDIKQSIYRWRSGDWRILANMRNELPGSATLSEKHLDTNRRSAEHIIQFNNQLFHKVLQLIASKCNEVDLPPQPLQEAYKDVCQNWLRKDKGNGYVEIQLIDVKSDENEEYTQETLNRLKETVLSLRSDGISINDIAILVRYNKHIPVIASFFAAEMPDIPVVSAEAFRLSASTALRLIIQAITYLTEPDNRVAAFLIAQLYQHEVLCHDVPYDKISSESPEHFFPDAFLTQKENMLMLPLYELIETLIIQFQIDRIAGQEAFIFFFMDEVMAYLKEHSGDLTTFLQYWDETLASKTIPSGLIDGIRIHSIHASKGLEFDHVLLPFCDWKLETNRDILWCEPQEEPFNQLPVVPVEYTSGLKESAFEKEYDQEKVQQWIDNINLLYVALTRPRYNLFIFGKLSRLKSGEVPTSDISGILYNALAEESEPSADQTDFYYNYGERTLSVHKALTPTENPLETHPMNISSTLSSHNARFSFRQSNKSMQFIGNVNDEQNRNEYLQDGLILHRIFASLRTEADIEPTLQQLENEGITGPASITTEKLRYLVQKGLQNPLVKTWFQPEWRILTECSILKRQNGKLQIRRPDRVMIQDDSVVVVDFKFGSFKPEYEEQVREYMTLLQEMGYQHIKGYLWFVYNNNIKPVNL